MRSDVIDIAKAIGIILMVVGHSGCPAWLHDFIYVFHMPLFFFLSGYCLKESHLLQPWRFSVRRLKQIYWPFVKWNILFFALNPLFFHIGITNEHYTLSEIAQLAKSVLTMGTWHELLGPFWFLRYLLLTNVVAVVFMFLLRRWPQVRHTVFLLLPVLPTLGWLLGLPAFTKGQLMLCIFFYYSGFAMQQFMPRYNRWYYPLLWLLTIVFSLFVKTELPLMEPRLTLVYAIAALTGIALTLATSHLISERFARLTVPLAWLGRHTLLIMVWHLLCFKLVSYAYILLWQLPSDQLFYITIQPTYQTWWTWIPYALTGLLGSVLLIILPSLLKNK